MTKCDFCKVSMIKNGVLECGAGEKDASLRSLLYCEAALKKYQKYLYDTSKSEKEEA